MSHPHLPDPVAALLGRVAEKNRYPGVTVCCDHTPDTGNVEVPVRLETPSSLLKSDLPAPFICFYDCLDNLPADRANTLVGRTRNLLSPHLAILLPHNSQWQLTELIALGFKREHPPELEGADLTGYFYDIGGYNHRRRWNNPKYWANPENFHKYRW